MKRQYKKPRGRALSGLLMAVCVSAAMMGCGQTGGEETAQESEISETIPVQAGYPQAGTLTLKNEFVGTISPEESVYVIPTVSAEVLSTDVSVGDRVEAGQVLCKLDSEAAQLQLASAKAQYDSVAANVDVAKAGYEAAQIGYEAAQAQYDSTAAQLEAQLGGQKNLQLYQLQAQVDNIASGINTINRQIADLEEDKKDAEDKKDDMKKARDRANDYLEQAGYALEVARAKVTALEPQSAEELKDLINNMYPDLATDDEKRAAYEADLMKAKEELAAVEEMYAQAGSTASAASQAYEQLKQGIESIEDGEEQLYDTLSDTYRNLEQAEVTKNITEEQIYSDTEKVVDASKKAAAYGIDSAAASVNSAAASVNTAQVGMESAQVAIDSAKYQLDMYTVKAPISGVIEAVNVDEHSFATPSSPAFIISNKETMTVTFYVSEGIRNTLSVGQEIQVDRDGRLYDAAITEIGSMIDQTTGLFAVKACVNTPNVDLLTGSSVKVAVDTYSQDNALLIPYDAVYYDDSQAYVYVAVDGVVERKNIETGIFDAETITVLSGLTVKDQIITSWAANLRDGALVSIQSEDGAATDGE